MGAAAQRAGPSVPQRQSHFGRYAGPAETGFAATGFRSGHAGGLPGFDRAESAVLRPCRGFGDGKSGRRFGGNRRSGGFAGKDRPRILQRAHLPLGFPGRVRLDRGVLDRLDDPHVHQSGAVERGKPNHGPDGRYLHEKPNHRKSGVQRGTADVLEGRFDAFQPGERQSDRNLLQQWGDLQNRCERKRPNLLLHGGRRQYRPVHQRILGRGMRRHHVPIHRAAGQRDRLPRQPVLFDLPDG